jgi:hypothetical protein
MKLVINKCYGGFGLSDAAIDQIRDLGGPYANTAQWASENRSHPILVEVVQNLGSAAFGECAKLAIVEIPDGVEFEIDEYDGIEKVRECSRSWG